MDDDFDFGTWVIILPVVIVTKIVKLLILACSLAGGDEELEYNSEYEHSETDGDEEVDETEEEGSDEDEALGIPVGVEAIPDLEDIPELEGIPEIEGIQEFDDIPDFGVIPEIDNADIEDLEMNMEHEREASSFPYTMLILVLISSAFFFFSMAHAVEINADDLQKLDCEMICKQNLQDLCIPNDYPTDNCCACDEHIGAMNGLEELDVASQEESDEFYNDLIFSKMLRTDSMNPSVFTEGAENNEKLTNDKEDFELTLQPLASTTEQDEEKMEMELKKSKEETDFDQTASVMSSYHILNSYANSFNTFFQIFQNNSAYKVKVNFPGNDMPNILKTIYVYLSLFQILLSVMVILTFFGNP